MKRYEYLRACYWIDRRFQYTELRGDLDKLYINEYFGVEKYGDSGETLWPDDVMELEQGKEYISVNDLGRIGFRLINERTLLFEREIVGGYSRKV